MSKFLDSTGLNYLWGKITTLFATKTELAAKPNACIYYGTCTTAAATAAKTATVETFPLDSNNKPLVGTTVGIKFSNSNTYKTAGTTLTLNVNNTGNFPMYYNNAELVSSTSANTLVGGYKNRHNVYMFNGTQWVWITSSYDTNSTYSAMSQAEIDAGTVTTGRALTPKMLRDNFYTEDEVDAALALKADVANLADVATSGSYNDLTNKPTIPAALSSLTDDSTHRTVSDAEKAAWNAKSNVSMSVSNEKLIINIQ